MKKLTHLKYSKYLSKFFIILTCNYLNLSCGSEGVVYKKDGEGQENSNPPSQSPNKPNVINPNNPNDEKTKNTNDNPKNTNEKELLTLNSSTNANSIKELLRKCETLSDYEKVLNYAQTIDDLKIILTHAQNLNLDECDQYSLHYHALTLPQCIKNYLYILTHAKEIKLCDAFLFVLYQIALNQVEKNECQNIFKHAENSNFDNAYLINLYEYFLLHSSLSATDYLGGLVFLMHVQQDLGFNDIDLVDKSNLVKIYKSALDQVLKDDFMFIDRDLDDLYKEALGLVSPNDYKALLAYAKNFSFSYINFIYLCEYILDQQNDYKDVLKCVKNFQLQENNYILVRLLKYIRQQHKHANDYPDILEYAKELGLDDNWEKE